MNKQKQVHVRLREFTISTVTRKRKQCSTHCIKNSSSTKEHFFLNEKITFLEIIFSKLCCKTVFPALGLPILSDAFQIEFTFGKGMNIYQKQVINVARIIYTE